MKFSAVVSVDLELVDVAVKDVKQYVDGHAVDVLSLGFDRNSSRYVRPGHACGGKGKAPFGVNLAAPSDRDLEGNFVPARKRLSDERRQYARVVRVWRPELIPNRLLSRHFLWRLQLRAIPQRDLT